MRTCSTKDKQNVSVSQVLQPCPGRVFLCLPPCRLLQREANALLKRVAHVGEVAMVAEQLGGALDAANTVTALCKLAKLRKVRACI